MKNLMTILVMLSASMAFGMDCELPLDLERFHQNPQLILDAHPIKLDENCIPKNLRRVQTRSAQPFVSSLTSEQINAGDFVEMKDQMRKTACLRTQDARVCLQEISPGQNVLSGRAAIGDLDEPSNILGSRYLKTLKVMDEQGLRRGKIAIDPWSSWYWPLAAGQLGFRFQDSEMVNILDNPSSNERNTWPKLHKYISNKSLIDDVNQLSPAEKYDRLVGDDNNTLSSAMWSAGEWFQNEQGKVAGWMGICHGWATASYMLPRPVKPIVVQSVNGEEITFLPDDLKALGSLIWANGDFYKGFMGGRCNDKKPSKNKYGRILSEECFDNNPGAWHMAIVNRIGRDKLSMVMDATYDYEVWNHPIVSYSYKYFNPLNMKRTQDLETAKVLIGDFSNDKFKEFRSEETYAVVGVIMEVKYLIETQPAGRRTDSVREDEFSIVHYTYDLELNNRGSIIGGEWYVNEHPDFLWTPYNGAVASSSVDETLPSVINLENLSSGRLKSAIKQAAPHASNDGQPLGGLVRALFDAAKKQ